MHSFVRGLFALSVVVFSVFFSEQTQACRRHECEATDVTRILLSHTLTDDIDAKGCHTFLSVRPQTGHDHLRNHILSFIKESKPLIFTLVGFPFKSGNIEKNVLGVLPDQGERAALETLQNIARKISKVYKPGAKIYIYTDGLAFYRLLGIPAQSVLSYEKALKQLASDLPSISIITLSDLLPQYSLSYIDRTIDAQSPGRPLDPAQMSILKKRVLKELDYPQGKTLLTQVSLEQIATAMHKRSQKINAFYKKRFPRSISLSVHYQSNLGNKVGISLAVGALTPWHGVPVLNKDGSFEIQRKKDVEKTHTLQCQKINGISCYFYSH